MIAGSPYELYVCPAVGIPRGNVIAPLELEEVETAVESASGAVPLYAIFAVVALPVKAKM